MGQLIRNWPDVAFCVAIAAITLGFSLLLDLPFSLPSQAEAAFVGVHYLYPLVGLAAWAGIAVIGQRRRLRSTFLVALPCYAIVMACHFNLKLWAPHINPALWDGFYWEIDSALRPLVDACFQLRELVAPILPLDGNFYIIAFITMFYVSFCYHALRTPDCFRSVFLGALFLQGTGALAYLVMPALGPFLYEPGIEPRQTATQLGMLGVWEDNAAGGHNWLAENGGAYLTTGLAAMPSLHAGGSLLFLLFARRYASELLPIYIPLFSYLCIAAVASRWHYLVDLPIGMILAYACFAAAERLTATGRETAEKPANSSLPDDDTGSAPALHREEKTVLTRWVRKLSKFQPY
ncbi:hypothetical protein FHS61_002461 [Altererythrobacter atlanticus]|uniref:Uncharacterized protein n=1 Tax=Croceibacterium atlanticum TaxID=1267766 RepID=A0A0F7KSA6_9SPHN|nr:phosphatase PAP2 family protein [Croceibacterium atlanticum]AKH42006.1 hypothetical protein WYH_00958 [Croceibacterium atlanticum]MBB5733426.1 hypothetical protein [Croceibacterium atlanticum]